MASRPFAVGSGRIPHRVSGKLVADLAAGAALTLAVALAVYAALGPPALYVGLVLLLYAALAGLILLRPPEGGSRTGLGPANRVTLARAGLVVPVTALLAVAWAPDAAASWVVATLTALALALDGADGLAARRTGSATSFGARFDLELDAFTLLVLSLFVWSAGQVGAWVVLIGGLRYLFVAAGWVRPWLHGPLPESFRRKAACVVQGCALVMAAVPVVPSAVASLVCALALALLVHSFAADVLWLARQAPGGSQAPA